MGGTARKYDKPMPREADVRARKESSSVIGAGIDNAANMVDRQYLADLATKLNAPDLDDIEWAINLRVTVARNISYLETHTRLAMLDRDRAKWHRVEAMMRMHYEGKPVGAETYRASFVRPWPKTTLPAWMADASLLPKKPPSKT